MKAEKLSYIKGSSWEQTATQRDRRRVSPTPVVHPAPSFHLHKIRRAATGWGHCQCPSTVPGTQCLSNYHHLLPSPLEPGELENRHMRSIKSSSAQSNGPRSPRRVGTEGAGVAGKEGGGVHEQNVSSSLYQIRAEQGAVVRSTLNLPLAIQVIIPFHCSVHQFTIISSIREKNPEEFKT